MGWLFRWFVVALALALLGAGPVAARDKRIALTFDDIPRFAGSYYTPDERTQRIIAALREAKVRQAAFFVNPARLQEAAGVGGEARIAAYVAAGHVIANHSNTHPSLGDVTADAYLADIDAAERWLAGRPGRRAWFRFPYLHEGGTDRGKRDAVRAGLAARGLRNGYVTADGYDWYLDNLTTQALKDGKQLDMRQLERLFVAAHLSAADYADDMARRTLGRSPAHVLLLHETDVTAMFLPALIAELRRHGWRIISADDAYRDPLQRAMPDVPNARGTLINTLAWEKDIKPSVWPIWMHDGITGPLFHSRVVKKTGTP